MCFDLHLRLQFIGQAFPIIISNITNYGLIPIIILFFVGQLNDIEHESADLLAGVSLSIMFANITGISLLIGMSSGVETMCSQLFGCNRLTDVGITLQRAFLILTCMCVPICLIWYFSSLLFALCGISPTVCEIIRVCLIIRMYGLPSDIFRSAYDKYLTSIAVTNPLMYASVFMDMQLIILCFAMVFVFKLDYTSICMSYVISSYVSSLLLLLLSLQYPVVQSTLQFPSIAMFHEWSDFLRLGFAGMCMLW